MGGNRGNKSANAGATGATFRFLFVLGCDCVCLTWRKVFLNVSVLDSVDSGIRLVIELTPIVWLSQAQKADASFRFPEVVTLGTLAFLAAFVLTFILVRTDRTTWSAKKQVS